MGRAHFEGRALWGEHFEESTSLVQSEKQIGESTFFEGEHFEESTFMREEHLRESTFWGESTFGRALF